MRSRRTQSSHGAWFDGLTVRRDRDRAIASTSGHPCRGPRRRAVKCRARGFTLGSPRNARAIEPRSPRRGIPHARAVDAQLTVAATRARTRRPSRRAPGDARTADARIAAHAIGARHALARDRHAVCGRTAIRTVGTRARAHAAAAVGIAAGDAGRAIRSATARASLRIAHAADRAHPRASPAAAVGSPARHRGIAVRVAETCSPVAVAHLARRAWSEAEAAAPVGRAAGRVARATRGAFARAGVASLTSRTRPVASTAAPIVVAAPCGRWTPRCAHATSRAVRNAAMLPTRTGAEAVVTAPVVGTAWRRGGAPRRAHTRAAGTHLTARAGAGTATAASIVVAAL